jgi:hypothetical protein
MPIGLMLLCLLALVLLVSFVVATYRSGKRVRMYHRQLADTLGMSVVDQPWWYWISGRVLVAEGEIRQRNAELRCIATASGKNWTLLSIEANLGPNGPVHQKWYLEDGRYVPDFFLAQLSPDLKRHIAALPQDEGFGSRILSVSVGGNFVDLEMSGLLNKPSLCQSFAQAIPVLFELAQEAESFSRRRLPTGDE